MKHLLLPVAFLLHCFVASPLRADSWAPPRARTVSSPGRTWQITIQPSAYATLQDAFQGAVEPGKGAIATLVCLSRPRETRSFGLTNPVMPVDLLLLDDGRLITFDHWYRLGHGQVMTLYTAEGKVAWSRTLEALVGPQQAQIFSDSISSRHWRRPRLDATLSEDGRSILLTLASEDGLRVSLADGEAQIVPAESLSDDADRLLARSDNLLRQGKALEAVRVLERAISLEPDFVRLYEALSRATVPKQEGYPVWGAPPPPSRVKALQEAHQKTAALLGPALARWGSRHPQPNRLPIRPGILGLLYIRLGTSQEAIGERIAAEASLRKAIPLSITPWEGTRALAGVLYGLNRDSEADHLLEALVATQTDSPLAPHRRAWAASDIGHFHLENQRYAQARETFLKAYTADQVVHQSLHLGLAQAYEALGQTKDALRVYMQLQASHPNASSRRGRSAEPINATIARLKQTLGQRKPNP